ncbi:Uncharacterised protein [Vibrio cholerae]|nr:Uncharacterised protein [Vibrio cholerae]
MTLLASVLFTASRLVARRLVRRWLTACRFTAGRFALIGFITAVRTTLPARFVTTQRIKARLAMRMLGRKTIRAMTT